MARNLTAGFITELQAQIKSPAIFFEGEFKTGTVHLWTGLGDIDWNGETWLSSGGLITNVSQISETSDVRADGIVVLMSGISEIMRSLILSEVEQGKPGTVYIGFINDSGAVVADPANAFEGRLDVPSMKDGGSAISISFAYETRLRDLERVREFRYTHESQKILFDDDLGFEYVPSLQDWNGVWGRA